MLETWYRVSEREGKWGHSREVREAYLRRKDEVMNSQERTVGVAILDYETWRWYYQHMRIKCKSFALGPWYRRVLERLPIILSRKRLQTLTPPQTVWRKARFEAGSLHFHRSHTRKSPSKAPETPETSIQISNGYPSNLAVLSPAAGLSSLLPSFFPRSFRFRLSAWQDQGMCPRNCAERLASVFLISAFLSVRTDRGGHLHNNSQVKRVSSRTRNDHGLSREINIEIKLSSVLKKETRQYRPRERVTRSEAYLIMNGITDMTLSLSSADRRVLHSNRTHGND